MNKLNKKDRPDRPVSKRRQTDLTCSSALNWAQIGRIVYGALDPKRGYSLYSPSLLHPKTQVQAGVLAEECSALMTDFFKGKR